MTSAMIIIAFAVLAIANSAELSGIANVNGFDSVVVGNIKCDELNDISVNLKYTSSYGHIQFKLGDNCDFLKSDSLDKQVYDYCNRFTHRLYKSDKYVAYSGDMNIKVYNSSTQCVYFTNPNRVKTTITYKINYSCDGKKDPFFELKLILVTLLIFALHVINM